MVIKVSWGVGIGSDDPEAGIIQRC